MTLSTVTSPVCHWWHHYYIISYRILAYYSSYKGSLVGWGSPSIDPKLSQVCYCPQCRQEEWQERSFMALFRIKLFSKKSCHCEPVKRLGISSFPPDCLNRLLPWYWCPICELKSSYSKLLEDTPVFGHSWKGYGWMCAKVLHCIICPLILFLCNSSRGTKFCIRTSCKWPKLFTYSKKSWSIPG